MASGQPAAWRVVLFAAAVPLLLRAVRIDRLGAWIEPRRPPADPRAFDAARGHARDQACDQACNEIIRRIDRLRRAFRPLVRSGCLTRGITLYHFLRRAGAPVSLHFGVGDPGDGFAGHCWVELAGEPVAEPRDPRPLYPEMLRFPQSS
jgi:hypothetical protein